jgi:UDP-2,3-diacylglucosamine pyrophosphatase LpxH
VVLHGDEFDAVVMAHRWLAFLGDTAYNALIQLNTIVNGVRRMFHLPYWSLAKHLKRKVKNAVEVISHFEEAGRPPRAAARCPGRGLRPHSHRRDPPDRRRHLLQ